MGFPRHIFTEKGTQFTSMLAKELAKVFGMTQVYTSKVNPQSNGQMENLNRVNLTMLSKIGESPNADGWDEQLPYVQAAYMEPCIRLWENSHSSFCLDENSMSQAHVFWTLRPVHMWMIVTIGSIESRIN